VTPGRRRDIAVAAAGFATFVNLYTPQAFLSVLATDLRFDEVRGSLAITVSLLAVALVAPLAGAISDRFGRKRLMVGAAFGVVIPTLLVAAAPSFAALLFWRFVQGLMLPFVFTIAVAYVGEECEGPDAIRTTGLYASGTIVGGFAGRFIGGVAAGIGGWRVAFVTLAVITLIAATVMARLLPIERRFRPMLGGLRGTLAGYAGHFRNRRLLGTCLVGFGMLFSLVAAFTFVNFRLSAPPFGLGPGALGAVFAVYLLGAIAAPLASRAAARIGRQGTMAAAVAIGIGGIALTLLPSIVAIVAGLALTGVGLFVTQALSLSFIPTAVRQARSAAVGLYVTTYYIGGALGGVVPIGLWRRAGWPGVVALVACVMAAMAGLAIRTWRPAPAPG
jgi:predicted MFS family arabinose efflux permease